MEHWSFEKGKNASPYSILHYSITPLLQFPITSGRFRSHLQPFRTSVLLTPLERTMTTTRPTRTTTARKAVWLLCLALFLSLQAVAAVPGLHRLLHHDADQADHQCAVTLLSHGNLHVSTAPQTSILLPAAFCFIMARPCDPIFVSIDYQLLPGRAPPASLLG
jgi:acetyl esterase/lipase